MTDTETKPRGLSDLFRQGEWWKQKGGEWIRIADMERSHRANTAAMLTRKAEGYAYATDQELWAYCHDAPDDVIDSLIHEGEMRKADPIGWITGTPLFKALTDGIRPDGRIDDVMMAEADKLRPYGVAVLGPTSPWQKPSAPVETVPDSEVPEDDDPIEYECCELHG